MSVYLCTVCGFRYDEWLGDSKNGVPPGISFERLAGSVCSTCGLTGGRHERLPGARYTGLEATYYDQFAGKTGLVFFRDWILNGELPASVLELGVGTGRIAMELVKHGITVCGVDNSPDMLELAGKKRSRLGKGKEHLWELVEQDALQLNLNRSFTHVLLNEGFLQHFTRRSEQRQVLQRIWEHLSTGGFAAVEIILPPAGHEWRTQQRKWVFPDKMVYQHIAGETSLARQLFRYSLTYETYLEQVEQPRYRVEREMALILPGELELLLEAEQWRIVAVHEDDTFPRPTVSDASQEEKPSFSSEKRTKANYDPDRWREGGYPFVSGPGECNTGAARIIVIAQKKTL
ncbi:methyltransferase domain-containing protein [Brevibacillus ruminantium]|uniref:Methyltransferase domain-containing protein n=1 Tax=Brevibacillus ruminantium TaxID=2950604 RepID=A0ABY4WA15_9BACL|nr:methyltransferase domain-containing protein [Brevibacillus ruminantium]USG63888.1 methyltransferase domain-containing protein [Brevibacillus ruminantium]